MKLIEMNNKKFIFPKKSLNILIENIIQNVL